jgi:hypothetical protein
MTEQTTQWEYRVLTVGGAISGAKDGQIEEVLNEWGLEGWVATQVYTPSQSNKVTIVARRELTARSRRQRSMP